MRPWRNEREMESHATGESKAVSRVNTCRRCGGHMTLEDFVDYGGTYQPSGSVAWRCMNCGNRVDELILQHQHAPPSRAIRGRFNSRVV